jgi:hypothetical protein
MFGRGEERASSGACGGDISGMRGILPATVRGPGRSASVWRRPRSPVYAPASPGDHGGPPTSPARNPDTGSARRSARNARPSQSRPTLAQRSALNSVTRTQCVRAKTTARGRGRRRRAHTPSRMQVRHRDGRSDPAPASEGGRQNDSRLSEAREPRRRPNPFIGDPSFRPPT